MGLGRGVADLWTDGDVVEGNVDGHCSDGAENNFGRYWGTVGAVDVLCAYQDGVCQF